MGVAKPDDPIETFVAKCFLDCNGSKEPSGDLDPMERSMLIQANILGDGCHLRSGG
jgi:hypothetical protein